MRERFAAITVFLVILIIPGTILWYQYSFIPKQFPADVRVVNLTAVGANVGAYTAENVNGLNYWWKKFRPVTLFFTVGDKALIRFQSADTTHRFYVPGLGLGPVDVRPGHIEQVEFVAEKPGSYQYFCVSMCGPCHFYMTGWIVVSQEGEIPEAPPPVLCPICYVDYGMENPANNIELGEALFQNKGCVTCHGIEGRGGVKNLNYAKETVPAHHNTTEKLFLREMADAELFCEFLNEHDDLESIASLPDIPLVNVVLDRYRALNQIIKTGSQPEKMDSSGPNPPLWMPAWKYMLTAHERKALILYFISLTQWDEELEEE